MRAGEGRGARRAETAERGWAEGFRARGGGHGGLQHPSLCVSSMQHLCACDALANEANQSLPLTASMPARISALLSRPSGLS